MDKVKCVGGHFFDRDKFSTCPFCGGAVAGQAERSGPVAAEPSRRSGQAWDNATQMLEERPSSQRLTGGAHSFRPRSERISQRPPQPSLVEAVDATGFGDISPLPRTTSYYELEETEPPVGWLVCVSGVYRGKAFPCKAGRNTVGRGSEHDIRLEEDTSVTRKPHAFVIYEPRQRRFFVQNGTGGGLVYHKGELLFDHAPLQAYDQLQIGKGSYLFLPLCGERFSWDEEG